MDAIGVLIMGAGGWLLYSAYKGNGPLTTAKSAIAASIGTSSSTSSPVPVGGINTSFKPTG